MRGGRRIRETMNRRYLLRVAGAVAAAGQLFEELGSQQLEGPET